jgi:streptogramin lyase
MGPARVFFAGGASAPAFSLDFTNPYSGDVTSMELEVIVPPGAQSGPATIVTPEGSATSSQSLTIVPGFKIPNSITAGPDGNLWFTEDVGNIGRIKPSGAIKEFPLPSGASDPTGIASGADGNLWFTENGAIGGNKIGRITPSGMITEFAPP